MASSFTFHPHEELRDPTREELYTGPTREKLPVAIQQLPTEETACTFCGVSYFVFAEVQQLQETVKKYKSTFRDFVRFLERERRISQTLKTQVVTLRKEFVTLSAQLGEKNAEIALECMRLRRAQSSHKELEERWQHKDAQSQEQVAQIQQQWKQAQETWKIESSLTEQKMRNEILHLSSQLEKCKIVSASQEAQFQSDMANEQARMKELESQLFQAQALVTQMERNIVTERDERKQQLLAAQEKVDVERQVAKQLETQLRAVQQELSRMVASSEHDHTQVAQLHTEIATLKQQLQTLEKQQAALVAERKQMVQEQHDSNESIRKLRAEASALERQLQTNAMQIETSKQEYTKQLEKLRLDHGHEINKLQRDHSKSMEELKLSQRQYLEFLEKETSDIKANAENKADRIASLEAKLQAAERQTQHWKEKTQECMDQLQASKLQGMELRKVIENMEKKTSAMETDARTVQQEIESLVLELEQHRAKLHASQSKHAQEIKALHDAKQQLEAKATRLQQRMDQLNVEKEAAEKKADEAMASAPQNQQWAWQPSSGHQKASSNNNQDDALQETIQKLRQTLEQREREITLLQQTVHRECMERTSLLEKLRSAKVLPDVPATTTTINVASSFYPSSTAVDEREDGVSNEPELQPKASFYEKLRRAGQRKGKPHKK